MLNWLSDWLTKKLTKWLINGEIDWLTERAAKNWLADWLTKQHTD